MRKYLIFASIGFELVGMIVASVYIAKPLDQKYHTDGLILVGLLLSVLIGWLVHVVFLLKKVGADDEK